MVCELRIAEVVTTPSLRLIVVNMVWTMVRVVGLDEIVSTGVSDVFCGGGSGVVGVDVVGGIVGGEVDSEVVGGLAGGVVGDTGGGVFDDCVFWDVGVVSVGDCLGGTTEVELLSCRLSISRNSRSSTVDGSAIAKPTNKHIEIAK